ncbi:MULTISPECIES: cupin domain-containing protein [Methylococcus]|uniref:Cupin domain-containing protein n=1 Tax=Methylococcus capsulatus TaxID=414 RepID=A0ABZ2F1T0_METCP|nr:MULTISPECIES: cupin domain-containing protein [Methylococcus]MDF9391872.1 cupin domain-containing protein [Methylococcus capsulatus]
MSRKRFHLYFILLLGLPCFGATAVAEEPVAARQLLLQKTVILPANTVDTRLIRVRFPPGYKTPIHTHQGTGPRYVLQGRLRVEDAGERHDYGAGDVFWETGSAMTVENIGGNDAELVIFELGTVE